MRENGEDIKSKISLFCKLKKVKKTWNARSAIATGLAHLQAAVQCYSKFINKNKIPNHFSLMFFGCERPIFSHRNGDLFMREDVVFFSRAKICSFHVWRYHVLFTFEDIVFFSLVKIPCCRAYVHLLLHWCLAVNSIVSDKGARQSGHLREVVVYGKSQQKEAQTELINVII